MGALLREIAKYISKQQEAETHSFSHFVDYAGHNTVAFGKAFEGMYIKGKEHCNFSAVKREEKDKKELQQWHKRLGHNISVQLFKREDLDLDLNLDLVLYLADRLQLFKREDLDLNLVLYLEDKLQLLKRDPLSLTTQEEGIAILSFSISRQKLTQQQRKPVTANLIAFNS
ncbi:translocon at the outer envelope membrane ofchloroplasts 34 [Striga asiatica]|uniref:Translocon at the outer envelope membrane ofchloroplasts 34 n=1 Tax=Striga asiatica TaxID=4170 RepID=A0A5A7P4C8_STRAF|nr:translocon at the outer envelope membrane ofchloroplasts 34 [Striga asiatica]